MYFKFKHEIYVLKQKERKRRKRNIMVFFKKLGLKNLKELSRKIIVFMLNK